MPAYLSHYRFLRTRDLDESRAVMSGVWGEHKVTPTTRMPFATVVNHAQIGQAGLTFVDCRTPLLIERVVVADGGLEIIWRDQGWQELAVELMPGTIGAELQELEATA